MPLKITRTIETRPQKVGRNDPCPCGSGKKYKKCCLVKEEQYSPSIHKGQVSRLADWAGEQPFFSGLLKKKTKQIFGSRPLEELEFTALMEALLFEEKIAGQTILEKFIREAPLSKEEQKIYQSWPEKSFFSFFEIIDVNIGKSLRLKNLKDNQDYLVFERMGTYQIQKGMIIPARLIPLGNFWMLAGGLSAIFPPDEQGYYFLKRNIKNLAVSEKMSELDFIKIFYGKESQEEQKEDGRKIKSLTHQQAKEQLLGLLKKYDLSYQIADIEAMIIGKMAMDQEKIIQELSQHASSDEELKEWIDLFYHYWQSHPKFEDESSKPGPIESNLLQQLMSEVQEQDFNQFPLKKATNLTNEFCQQWFDIPQEELAGKTPRAVIMQERKKLGNSHQELVYQFSCTPIRVPANSYGTDKGDELSEKYNLATRLMAKEYQYWPALKLFSQLIDEIDFLEEEKYRWYGKVGTCLANLGEIDLAKTYFQKSLQLNPDYEISKKNLEIFGDAEKLKFQKDFGKEKLFRSILEDRVIWEIKGVKNCHLWQDALTFLNHLEKNKVLLSEKQRLIHFKDVLAINKKFIQPDRESRKIGKYTEVFRSQWQMFKVNFLYYLTKVGSLTKDDQAKLVLTKEGKSFLTKTPEQQFSQIFAIWFRKLCWDKLEERPNSKLNFSAPIMENFQNQSWKILKTLQLISPKKIFGYQKFSRKELLEKLFGLHNEQKNELLQFQKTFLSLFIERAILNYLVWANIIKPELKSQIKDDFLPHLSYDEFYLTSFGWDLISEIETAMKEAIPETLRDLA